MTNRSCPKIIIRLSESVRLVSRFSKKREHYPLTASELVEVMLEAAFIDLETPDNHHLQETLLNEAQYYESYYEYETGSAPLSIEDYIPEIRDIFFVMHREIRRYIRNPLVRRDLEENSDIFEQRIDINFSTGLVVIGAYGPDEDDFDMFR